MRIWRKFIAALRGHHPAVIPLLQHTATKLPLTCMHISAAAVWHQPVLAIVLRKAHSRLAQFNPA
jgi:hypothetical protein